jgi:hypothetical protein
MAMHQDWAGHDLHGLPNGEQTCQRKSLKIGPCRAAKPKQATTT